MDFQKAFDSVSHSTLITKLQLQFGITGNLLAWLQDYLTDRLQYTVLNGTPSDNAKVTAGIPQGNVLGPTLFTLYTSDLPGAIKSATFYMYADDTTIFCIGDSVDEVIVKLNKALEELVTWCKQNSLVPHPKKCEGMILKRKKFTGPLPSLNLNGCHTLDCWDYSG